MSKGLPHELFAWSAVNSVVSITDKAISFELRDGNMLSFPDPVPKGHQFMILFLCQEQNGRFLIIPMDDLINTAISDHDTFRRHQGKNRVMGRDQDDLIITCQKLHRLSSIDTCILDLIDQNDRRT